MFKFITHKSLLINVLFGILIIMLLILGFFATLNWFTSHDQNEKVPTVTNVHIDVARTLLESKGFKVVVADSVYDPIAPKLTVLKQSPEAEALVKKGRTIYLTLNRVSAPLVDMPSLVGLSFKSAEMFLQSVGLKLGDTTFKPDIAKNSVLQQFWDGREVKQGTKIPIGSKISLVIASGIGDEEIDVPNLVGLTFFDARSLLGNMGINLGNPILLDSQIKDTLKAFVVKQEPPVFTEMIPSQPNQKYINKIRKGQLMDLWLSATPPPKDSLIMGIDTTLPK